MASYQAPGVYQQDEFPARTAELEIGVPAFLGFAAGGPVAAAERLTVWPRFEKIFGTPAAATGYLAAAVRGFFENRGKVCYVVRLAEGPDPPAAFTAGLRELEKIDAVDLVCAPDLFSYPEPEPVSGDETPAAEAARRIAAADAELRMQAELIDHCNAQGDRLAILDALPGASIETVLEQRTQLAARGSRTADGAVNAALYYPWVRPLEGSQWIPSCGHVAGAYARSDRHTGVHKAPANEVLEGVLDLEIGLASADQERLNPEGVNALRAFPGRGIRVWGARTLSREPAWTWINVRRVVLTAGRWIERHLADAAFEPNDERLWAGIRRDLGSYLENQYRRGALRGASARQAFYVHCDADTNPGEVRDLGQVITEIGLRPADPGEVVVVRIIHGAGGVTLSAPSSN